MITSKFSAFPSSVNTLFVGNRSAALIAISVCIFLLSSGSVWADEDVTLKPEDWRTPDGPVSLEATDEGMSLRAGQANISLRAVTELPAGTRKGTLHAEIRALPDIPNPNFFLQLGSGQKFFTAGMQLGTGDVRIRLQDTIHKLNASKEQSGAGPNPGTSWFHTSLAVDLDQKAFVFRLGDYSLGSEFSEGAPAELTEVGLASSRQGYEVRNLRFEPTADVTLPKPPGPVVFRTSFGEGLVEDLRQEPARLHKISGTEAGVDSPTTWDELIEKYGLWFNYVDHTGGMNPKMLGAYLVPDPENPKNRVFYAWQKDAELQSGNFDSRIQAEMKGFAYNEVLYRFRFRLSPEIVVGNQPSVKTLLLSLVEMGSLVGSSHMSRVILHKWGSDKDWSDGKAPLRWRAEVLVPGKGHTFYKDSGVEPKYGQWQTMIFYVKAGDATTGRFFLKIDDQVLFDETINTADNRTWETTSFFKSYGGDLARMLKAQGKEHEVWFDDLELYMSNDGDLAAMLKTP